MLGRLKENLETKPYWSLKEVRRLIKKIFGMDYSDDHVRKGISRGKNFPLTILAWGLGAVWVATTSRSRILSGSDWKGRKAERSTRLHPVWGGRRCEHTYHRNYKTRFQHLSGSQNLAMRIKGKVRANNGLQPTVLNP
jgi:hypothetical protein